MKHPVLAALCIYFGFLLIMGLLPGGLRVSAVGFAAYCMLTGIVEEAVFCGCIFNLLSNGKLCPRHALGGASAMFHALGGASAMPHGFKGALSPHRLFKVESASPHALEPELSPYYAAYATAALFGIAHLSFAEGVGPGVLKVMQAGFFSLCMVGVYIRSKRLWIPMAAHSAFDILYFAAPYAATGCLPSYSAAHSLDANLVVVAATTLFFAICAIIIVRLSANQAK